MYGPSTFVRGGPREHDAHTVPDMAVEAGHHAACTQASSVAREKQNSSVAAVEKLLQTRDLETIDSQQTDS